jgi:hypothetical protein
MIQTAELHSKWNQTLCENLDYQSVMDSVNTKLRKLYALFIFLAEANGLENAE